MPGSSCSLVYKVLVYDRPTYDWVSISGLARVHPMSSVSAGCKDHLAASAASEAAPLLCVPVQSETSHSICVLHTTLLLASFLL